LPEETAMTTLPTKYLRLDEEMEYDTAMDASGEIDVDEMDDIDLDEPTWILLERLGLGE
jgi:hypothetical protein